MSFVLSSHRSFCFC